MSGCRHLSVKKASLQRLCAPLLQIGECASNQARRGRGGGGNCQANCVIRAQVPKCHRVRVQESRAARTWCRLQRARRRGCLPMCQQQQQQQGNITNVFHQKGEDERGTNLRERNLATRRPEKCEKVDEQHAEMITVGKLGRRQSRDPGGTAFDWRLQVAACGCRRRGPQGFWFACSGN